MKATEQKRNLPSLQRSADFLPSSINVEERTVDVCFGTDTPVLMGYWEQYNEILRFNAESVRMDRMNAGAPLLWMHDKMEQLGAVVRGWVDGKKGYATVKFSRSPEAEQKFQDVQDGILKNVSVGYRVYAYREIDGGEGKMSTYEATDWEPMEVSLVTVPADFLAGVRTQSAQENEVLIYNNRSIMEPINPNKPVEPTPAPVAPSGVSTEEARSIAATAAETAMKAERQRGVDIRSAAKKAGLSEEFANTLVENGASVEEARTAIIEEISKQDPNAGARGAHTGVRMGRDEIEKEIECKIAGLAMRSGADIKISDEARQGARQHRNKTLVDLCKESLQRMGIDFSMMDKMDIVGRAIVANTSDFPILLSGLNRQVLLAAYNATPDTWREFCMIGSVDDFRSYRRLRFGSISNLDSLAENGEFRNKSISDAEYETISASTKGNVINLSRQMIINDDLNALVRIVTGLGRAANRTIEADVYKLLALNSGNGPTMQDGNPLFHSSHKNIAATPAAPSVAAFDAVRVQMKQQKDPSSNEYLSIAPSIWLGPTALSGATKVVNNAQFDVDVTNKYQVPNKSYGMYSKLVDSPRLSGTPWYSFADPNIEPVIEVAFLGGNQTPFLDSEQAFNVDGFRWKVRHDYGVGAVGYRGAVLNAGA